MRKENPPGNFFGKMTDELDPTNSSPNYIVKFIL